MSDAKTRDPDVHHGWLPISLSEIWRHIEVGDDPRWAHCPNCKCAEGHTDDCDWGPRA